MIVKINPYANDFPPKYDMEQPPAFYWKPKKEGVEPVLYKGEQTLEAFLEFIRYARVLGVEKIPEEQIPEEWKTLLPEETNKEDAGAGQPFAKSRYSNRTKDEL